MNKQRSKPGLARIECDGCGAQPEVFWDTEMETVAIGCDCGERMVPRDCVLEHDLMPADVTWTVEDDDATL